MLTPFLKTEPMTFAEISSEEYIYNEATMSNYGAVIGKAVRRVAALVRVTERSFTTVPQSTMPSAF